MVLSALGSSVVPPQLLLGTNENKVGIVSVVSLTFGLTFFLLHLINPFEHSVSCLGLVVSVILEHFLTQCSP